VSTTAPPLGAAATERTRIAVIDDEVDTLTFVRFLLEDHGYEVLTSAGPANALAHLESFRPHLVVLDLLMPGQLGFSLLIELRRHRQLRAVPILILSGLNARKELAEALRAAGDVTPPEGWVEKPIEPEAFLQAVSGALPHSSGAVS
jgi:two-component system alkaline phosphatase synthesis response regulator PhoP